MEGFNLSGRNKGLVSVSTTVQDESTEEGKEPSWKDMSIIKFWARQDACPESEIIQMIFSKNQCLL